MNVNDPSITSAVHAVGGVAFWFLLVTGAITTIARLAYYRAKGARAPRLLRRDVLVIGGFALFVGVLLLVRATGLGPSLRDNWLYAAGTDGIAIFAAGVYVYFEVFVIERGRDAERDSTYDVGPRDNPPGQPRDEPLR